MKENNLYETARDLYDGDWRHDDINQLAATLANWRKEAQERGDEIDETYTVEEETRIICEYLADIEAEVEDTYDTWYAVQRDEDDTDWGTGSHDLIRAKKMTKIYGQKARIAVINEGYGHDPICVHVLQRDEAGNWKDEEGRYR